MHTTAKTAPRWPWRPSGGSAGATASPLNQLPVQQVPLLPLTPWAWQPCVPCCPITPRQFKAPTPIDGARLAHRPLQDLADSLAASGKGLIMVMGKGGVGKTTIAAALALALVKKGHAVHLSTTDPAAHLASTLQTEVPGLEVSRIDPKAETRRYVDKVMSTKGAQLNADRRALLLEDLQSPAPKRWPCSTRFRARWHKPAAPLWCWTPPHGPLPAFDGCHGGLPPPNDP